MRETSDRTFVADVAQSPVPVLLDIWAPWCQPCIQLTPLLQQLEQGMGGKLAVVKLNLDQNPNVGATYQVRSLPTLLLFNGGQLVNRMTGHPGSLQALDRFVRTSLGL